MKKEISELKQVQKERKISFTVSLTLSHRNKIVEQYGSLTTALESLQLKK